MTRIVVGIDGLEASRRALRWAAHEAKLRQATLHIVHSWPRPYLAFGPSPRLTRRGETSDVERRIAEELLDRELARTGVRSVGVKIEREVVEGDPAKVLLEAAAGADLLVLGSNRHGMLAGTILGEVAQRCVQHGPCPVVIVRESADDGVA
jgi:nucleotide-binding universal stress UspA family protein